MRQIYHLQNLSDYKIISGTHRKLVGMAISFLPHSPFSFSPCFSQSLVLSPFCLPFSYSLFSMPISFSLFLPLPASPLHHSFSLFLPSPHHSFSIFLHAIILTAYHLLPTPIAAATVAALPVTHLLPSPLPPRNHNSPPNYKDHFP